MLLVALLAATGTLAYLVSTGGSASASEEVVTTFDDTRPQVSTDIATQDENSKSRPVSNELWGTSEPGYVADMAQRLSEAQEGGVWAVAVDVSRGRVGVFSRGSQGVYQLVRAFNADMGYIDPKTGSSHTFTGTWFVDHKAKEGPEGASFFTCYILSWTDDGQEDGQGFHSGYDGVPSYESAGCVRLYYNDAAYIYDNVPGGSLVMVY